MSWIKIQWGLFTLSVISSACNASSHHRRIKDVRMLRFLASLKLFSSWLWNLTKFTLAHLLLIRAHWILNCVSEYYVCMSSQKHENSPVVRWNISRAYCCHAPSGVKTHTHLVTLLLSRPHNLWHPVFPHRGSHPFLGVLSSDTCLRLLFMTRLRFTQRIHRLLFLLMNSPHQTDPK